MKAERWNLFLLVVFAAALLISCGPKKTEEQPQQTETKPEQITGEKNLDFLKKYDGKYADEVHLFEKQIFADRLGKLIGTENFKMIKDDWTTIMPMEFGNNVFSAEGCKPHDCGANNYIIVYDFSEDAMYAGISNNEKAETFSENGKTSPKVEKWKPM